MKSLILQSATRVMIPLLLAISVFMLARGHNEPGGGFIGGLIAASALVVHGIAFGTEAVRSALRVDPRTLMGVGLLVALVSGVGGLLAGQPYMTGIWGLVWTPVGWTKSGTPILFDLGVYTVVIGVVVGMYLDFAEAS